ncbi:MAG: twin-arginine translocation signal domain-containing protein [Bacteroidales bacterium]|jgi:L-alanine-DL-glutamate epimerase-like enolase superfamily enzyme|nr:twin-arginine translocation signal domain-containing protein [Bacteroidales bacterium]
MNRRNFIKNTAVFAALGATGIDQAACTVSTARNKAMKPFRVTATGSNFEREPLVRPFGFKGGYMKEIWQTAVMLQGDSGTQKAGICTHNVLWSDAEVFAAHSEAAGNAIMFAMTERGLQMIKGQSFESPVHMVDSIMDELWRYGQKITDNPHLRKTFALNALVGVDNAAWLLYAAENGIANFDDLIPPAYRPALSHRHKTVASIPLMAYNIPINEIVKAVDDGYFFMKIKIGQPGTQEEMLQKDMDRLTAIHQAIGNRTTTHSKNGKLPYYFDANGRYEKKETLQRLIDHARKIGAFDQIAIIEEPFPEESEVDVSDLGVRLAADESAHTDADALKRIQMGYKAIALKAIAKTMSMTMKIAQVAHEHHVPCFCADLTVNPILVEWNKIVAARLSPFPGLGAGLLETNGHQNYKNWDRMLTYNPASGTSWAKTVQGVFNLDQDYYNRSGGIFEPSEHYEEWFKMV